MRWFAIIGGLLVLVLVAALGAPLFVNFDDYRTQFEAEASRILGQPVTVDGRISASLIPFPSITLNELRVGAEDDPLMLASSLSLYAELAPFLSGEIRIFDAQLNDPVVRLTLEEGWSPTGTMQLPGLPAGVEVGFENARISNGLIAIEDELNARTWQIEVTEATLAANSLAGPWRMEAQTFAQARQMDLRFTLGRVDPDSTAVSLNGEMSFADEQIRTRLEGAIDLTGAAQLYDGTFTVMPTDELVVPYRIDGDLDVFADRIVVESLAGNFGDQQNPYVVRGEAALFGGEDPSYMIRVTGNQFGGLAATQGEASGGEEPRPNARLAQITDTILNLPLPAGVPGNIQLDLPALVFGDTIIRDLVVDARPGSAPNNWSIRRFTAELPGRTAMVMIGSLRLPARGEPLASGAFRGSLLLASRQPSGLARWIAGDAGERVRALPQIGIDARVDASIDQQRFDITELRIGTSTLAGTVERRSPSIGTPVLLGDLSGDGVALENLAALGELFGFDAQGSWLTSHQIEADLLLNEPELWGLNPASLELSMRPQINGIEFDKLLVTDLDGVSMAATGSLNNSGDAARSLAFDMDISSANGAKAAGYLPSLFPGIEAFGFLADRAALLPDLFDDMAINVVGELGLADDRLDELTLGIGGSLAQMQLSGDVRIGSAGDAARIDGSLGMESASGADTILAWMTGSPFASFDSAAAGSAQITANGRPDDTLNVDLGINLGADTLAFDTVTRQMPTVEGFQSVLSGSFTVNVGDPSAYDAALPAMPLGLFGGAPLSASGGFEATDDAMSLSDVAGTFGGAEIRLRAFTNEAADGVRADVSIDHLRLNSDLLNNDALQAALSGWRVGNADVQFSADLISIDDRAVLANAQGDFDASVGDGRVFANVQIDQSEVAAGGEARLRLQTQFSDDGVQASVSGQGLSLVPHALFGAFVPETRADISLTASASGDNWRAALETATGTGSALLQQMPVSGIDIEALGPIMEAADAIGFEIEEQQIRDLADANLIQDEARNIVPLAETPFLIDDGLLRFSNMRIAWPSALLTLSGAVDPLSRTLGANGAINFIVPDSIEGLLPPVVEIVGTLGVGRTPIWAITDHSVLVTNVRQRAIETEQRRIEALQARLLDRQRLRRLLRLEQARLAALRQAEEEAALQQAREAAEAEARAAEEERARQEAEARAAEEERLRAEEEARAAEERARQEAEEEARRAEEERARHQAEARAAEEERLRAEEEARAAEERARREAEEEARRAEEERARQEAEAQAAEEERLRVEQEARAAEEQALQEAEVNQGTGLDTSVLTFDSDQAPINPPEAPGVEVPALNLELFNPESIFVPLDR
ncbi:MAG: hypothetical protein AAF940_05900 [Pseudomonadota bacterium]